MPELLRSGRYRLLGVIGSGAQAHTFEALDTTTDTKVAIKRFQVRGARSWKDVELAEREARVLSELDHPNLPKYLDHFEERGVLYLVMEKVEGPTLAELRRDGGSLGPRELLRFLEDAAKILEYLHGRAPPIIHRDIKPSNVIRRPDGSFALVDFGSVRDRLRPDGGSTVVGTFGFMAPEQFQGRALPTTDVYGVGATAIACLTGEEPENLPHKGLAIDVRRALGAGRDPRLVQLLEQLLEPDPDRRPHDLGRALGAIFGPERRPSSFGWEHEQQAPRSRAGIPVPRSGPRFGPLIVLIVILSLLVARLATFGLFRVALPFVLTILALFFGSSLRNAARRMREIGRAGEEGLRVAARRVRGMDQQGPPRGGARRRYRVAHAPTVETEGEAVEDFHDVDEFRERRSRRSR